MTIITKFARHSLARIEKRGQGQGNPKAEDVRILGYRGNRLRVTKRNEPIVPVTRASSYKLKDMVELCEAHKPVNMSHERFEIMLLTALLYDTMDARKMHWSARARAEREM